MKTLIVANSDFIKLARSLSSNPMVNIVSTSVSSIMGHTAMTVDVPDFVEFPEYVKVLS